MSAEHKDRDGHLGAEEDGAVLCWPLGPLPGGRDYEPTPIPAHYTLHAAGGVGFMGSSQARSPPLRPFRGPHNKRRDATAQGPNSSPQGQLLTARGPVVGSVSTAI